MNEAERNTYLDVLFETQLPSDELNEGVGTMIKHAGQNLVQNAKNAFAFTAAQKARARNQTATLKANQAAENAGNKQLSQAKKAGKKAYKDIMAKWDIKSASAALQNAGNDLDSFIQGVEYALAGIAVMNLQPGNDNQKEEMNNAANNAKNSNNQQTKNMNNDTQNAMAQTQDVAGNNNGGNNNGQ